MRSCLLFLIALLFTGLLAAQPRPAGRQLAWQKLETTAFLHFTVNTFTDKEWGDGTEDPKIFNPTDFNADRIVRILKAGGLKLVILTAKHHDGFCLWPSKYTEHSVKNSPWRNGKGDVVKEMADACRRQGLKFGIYLSPWDRHEPSYGTVAYNTYYKNQLLELLTGYGELAEVWFDGAKGPEAKNMSYDFKGFWTLVRRLQPQAVMFSDAGPDVRWVGNEKGEAGDICWSMIDTAGMSPGKADPAYLNTGAATGPYWIPAETDVSIRPGWFYHAAEDSKVKSARELVNLYYRSVGRNSLLLLNIPPDRRGRIAAEDSASLTGFRRILKETFAHNLALGVTASVLTDQQLSSFKTLKAGQSVIINFKKPVTFDRVMLQEAISSGQNFSRGLLEAETASGWQTLAEIGTIGYKRLLRLSPVTVLRLRLTVKTARAPVRLAEIGFFKASTKE